MGGVSPPCRAFIRTVEAASLLAWMAFHLHKASDLVKAKSNQVVNLALMLGILALNGLVASKLSILVVWGILVVFWNLGAFLVRLERYSVGPKTLSGILGWPSHLSGLRTVWAFKAQIIEAILFWI